LLIIKLCRNKGIAAIKMHYFKRRKQIILGYVTAEDYDEMGKNLKIGKGTLECNT